MSMLFKISRSGTVFAAIAGLAGSVITGIPQAQAALQIDELFWHPTETHCRFVRNGETGPQSGKPETWRYLFVTEIVSDDIASAERGYIRLGGLLRELEFLSRTETKKGEVRRYRTFGEAPVSIEIDMRAGEGKKSKLGQTILVQYTGTLTLARDNSQRFVPFSGSCGVKPES